MVTECDLVAAHPDDPAAVANGVHDDALEASAAIAACETAAAIDQHTARLRFQVARGYLKAGRFEDAIEQLIVAGQAGHGGAFAYLGDLALDGAPGLPPDPALAKSLYQHAAAQGFLPAIAILEQFEEQTEGAETNSEVEPADSAAAQSDPVNGSGKDKK